MPKLCDLCDNPAEYLVRQMTRTLVRCEQHAQSDGALHPTARRIRRAAPEPVRYACCDGTWATGHEFSCSQGGFATTRDESEEDER